MTTVASPSAATAATPQRASVQGWTPRWTNSTSAGLRHRRGSALSVT
ncbi:hypothetical protein [Nonomuraea sp. NPDC049684]